MRSAIGTISTPTRTDYNRGLFPRRALLLLACALAGAAGALLLMPCAVRVLHDDTSRLCAILDTSRSAPPARLAIYGNSAAMMGIDARLLGGWNFASPAQTLAEALLLQQELPKEVRTVVQIVTPSQLTEAIAVNSDHYNAMLMCGYHPRPESRAAVQRIFGARLDVHPLAARVYARRHVRAALEGLFVRNRGGWLPAHQFEIVANDSYPVNIAQVRMLIASNAGRRHVFVLAPIHPRLHPVPFLCPPELDCVDLRTLLAEDEFQDPTHPTPAGAVRLTRAIRDALAARRLL
jgi:hypothetical protein